MQPLLIQRMFPGSTANRMCRQMGMAVCPAVGTGRASREGVRQPAPFRRVRHPIETTMVTTTLTEGPQSFWDDTFTQVDLPGSKRAAQTSGCGKFWNLEVIQGTEVSEGVSCASTPSLMTFLSG